MIIKLISDDVIDKKFRVKGEVVRTSFAGKHKILKTDKQLLKEESAIRSKTDKLKEKEKKDDKPK